MTVKIIQIILTPNNSTWQGAILGLGDDGVTYEFSSLKRKWIVCLPLAFDVEE